MYSLLAFVVSLVALLVSWRREPRRLRNGALLVLTVAIGLVGGAAEAPEPLRTICTVVVLGAFAGLPIAALVTGVSLLANGVVVLTREQRSLGNALGALTGLAILLVLLVVTIVTTRTDSLVLLGLALTVAVLTGYVSLAFACFASYSFLYSLRRRVRPVDGVVVLGSGLVGGRVPPLLASRLRRGLELHETHRDRGWSLPRLVPSGGQGADEGEPEGTAMARWLREHGADDVDVVPETEARTTEQNLVLSGELLASHGGLDRPARMAIVTNDYHAFRAALLARRLGLNAETFGSRTAAYFVPSAYLREFVAVIRMHVRWHAAVMIALAGIMVALTAVSLHHG